MDKKGIVLGGIISLILAMSFVSAIDAGYISERVVQIWQDTFTPIIQALLGGYGTSEFVFIKLLVFILLVVMIRAGLSKVPAINGNKNVVFLIAVVVALLSVRFMPEDYISKYLLVMYGGLGVALTTLLSFLIYFGFVEATVESSFMRRFATALYIIVVFVIFILTSSEMGDFSRYIFIAVLCLAVVMFLFDNYLRKYLRWARMQKFFHRQNVARIAALQGEYEELMEGQNTAEKQERRRHIVEELRRLGGSAPGD